MKKLENLPEIFLGATGENGFVNRFSEVYNCDGWRAYIIKGGPGCGKSTFMKRIAEDFIDERPVLCRCSSDPNSLDAVILERRQIMIADGTSPHILEPKLPAARENLLNFFDILDNRRLYQNRKLIAETFAENARCHAAAYNCIRAAAALCRIRLQTAVSALDTRRALDYADSVSGRMFRHSNAKGRVISICLDAVTPDGYVSFDKTAQRFGCDVIAFDDGFGAAADCVLSRVAENAAAAGYTVYSAKSPILPNQTRGVIVPECGFAICIADFLSEPYDAYRTIHAKRFYDGANISSNRIKQGFTKRAVKEMLNAATDYLQEAKLVHDRLERYYIAAADFSIIDGIYQKLSSEIIGVDHS